MTSVTPKITSTDYQTVAQHHHQQLCLFFQGEDGGAVVFVATSWRVSVSEDLSVQCDTEAVHGFSCFIKAPPALCLSVCPFSARRCTPSWLNKTLAFKLLPRHLLLSENRERTRVVTPTLLRMTQSRVLSIHPGINPGKGGMCTPSFTYSVYHHNRV